MKVLRRPIDLQYLFCCTCGRADRHRTASNNNSKRNPNSADEGTTAYAKNVFAELNTIAGAGKYT